MFIQTPDVLGTLVRLSESDRPSGVQAYVLKTVQNMVIMLDEQFLVHSAVHRAVLRLLRNCVGDDIQEQLDGRNKLMGAAKNSVRSQPSEYEEDRTWSIMISLLTSSRSSNSGSPPLPPLQPYPYLQGTSHDILS